MTVAIHTSPAAQPVLGFFGAVLLGAGVRFDPPTEIDARVLLAPGESVEEYELPPGGQYVSYGDSAPDPTVSHFETDVWSENPVFPETPLPPETVALSRSDDREISHADLLDAGNAVASEWGLEPGDSVAVRAPLANPRTVAAGLIAPLLVGCRNRPRCRPNRRLRRLRFRRTRTVGSRFGRGPPVTVRHRDRFLPDRRNHTG